MLKTSLSALSAATLLFFSPFASADNPETKFVDESSYAIGVALAKNIEGLVEAQKDLFPYNQEQILAGVQDTLKKTGKLTDEEIQKRLQALDAYVIEKEQQMAAEKNKVTVASGEKFRAEFEKQAGVKKTASGLLYKIEKAGEGASPTADDTVKVHYKGTLTDGTVFDSSYERGEPVEFQLKHLIPAWIEAIPLLKKGGKMVLVSPPELAYGNRATGKIPANATLVFEIELLDFKSAK